MKPVSLIENFINTDFSAVFYEYSIFPIVTLSWDSLLNIG